MDRQATWRQSGAREECPLDTRLLCFILVGFITLNQLHFGGRRVSRAPKRLIFVILRQEIGAYDSTVVRSEVSLWLPAHTHTYADFRAVCCHMHFHNNGGVPVGAGRPLQKIEKYENSFFDPFSFSKNVFHFFDQLFFRILLTLVFHFFRSDFDV